jgi:osmotically-inducible protein OsmY
MKVKQEKIENKELRDRVELQLEWEPEVTSTDIGVAADDGIVTLTGSVESYSEKLAAENAAKHTSGVKGIANDISVTPLMKVTDSQIAAKAVSALEARSNVSSKDIKVTVKY